MVEENLRIKTMDQKEVEIAIESKRVHSPQLAA